MRKISVSLVIIMFSILILGCVSSAPEPKVFYNEILYTELDPAITKLPVRSREQINNQENSPQYGFIVEAYNLEFAEYNDIDWYDDNLISGTVVRFSGAPNGKPSRWFNVHDKENYLDLYNEELLHFEEPRQFENYDESIPECINKTKSYKVYIGAYGSMFYSDMYSNGYSSWYPFIDKIEGQFLTADEVKADKDMADAKANDELKIVYEEIPVSELEQAIEQVDSPGHGFIVEAVDIGYSKSEEQIRFTVAPWTYTRWFPINGHDEYDTYEPHQFESYDDATYKHIDRTKSHKFFIGVYQHKTDETFFRPFIDKIEGLLTDDEAVENEQQLKAKNDADYAERVILLDTKAKSLASGYIYHGFDEQNQNNKLFNNGALEAGHAYYVSNYFVESDGLMGGVIASLFIDPTYHIVAYVSQTVKGEVVGASQTIFGELPITIVVAGGKSPLHIPVILGLVQE